MVARVCALHGLHAGPTCPQCKAGLEQRSTARKRRSAAHRIRSSARWKKTVARVLERDGYRCTYGLYEGDDSRGLPLGGCRARRRLDVHHRTPIEDGGDAFDEENLRTLCNRHHAIVEAVYRQSKEDTGGEPLEV